MLISMQLNPRYNMAPAGRGAIKPFHSICCAVPTSESLQCAEFYLQVSAPK